MDTAIQEWLEIARDDLGVARILLEKDKCVYAVFMCPQAVEKTIKALYQQRFTAVPPRKHDLVRLADETGVLDACSDRQRAFLSTLTEFYVEARYPGDRLKLGAICNREFAEMLLTSTEEMIGWLDSQLSE